MREILFRGKRMDKDKWVEGYYTEFNPEMGNHIPVIESMMNDYIVYPDTVGQYVGRTDKNGKKIFEGDIIKAGWGYQGEVEFDSFKYAMMESTIDDNAEIIGNIHDNPELLTKEAAHE